MLLIKKLKSSKFRRCTFRKNIPRAATVREFMSYPTSQITRDSASHLYNFTGFFAWFVSKSPLPTYQISVEKPNFGAHTPLGLGVGRWGNFRQILANSDN